MLDLLTNPDVWIAFATLTALEIVLGIDNIVFISILAEKLRPEERKRARQVGLALALITRLALLASLAWVIGLTAPLFTVLGVEISGRDLVLLIGGLFLLAKATHEIHGSLEGGHAKDAKRIHATFAAVIVQILILDVVFSLDSVITAVGMVDQLPVMVAAVIVAVGVMLVAAGPLSAFVARHPTVKMLALSFLILIGVMLVAEGFDHHIPKGYIYFAMAFALGVEILNLRLRKTHQPVELHVPYPMVEDAKK
ncbi:MAG TPA: TerC family protein [Candidatus Thermoplasmatota archaeon]|nr:TerC family protein [Candidatus Thermoplasmatota archaeon]